MTIYAVGNEPESYTTTQSSISGQTAVKDANCRGGISTSDGSSSTNFAHLDLHTSVSEVWLRVLMNTSSNVSSSTSAVIGFYNSANSRDVVRIIQNGASGTFNNYTIQYNSSGSTYTDIGSFPFRQRTVSSNTSNELTVYVKLGSSGAVKVYSRNMLVYSTTGNFTANDSTFDFIRFAGSTTTNWGGAIAASTALFGYALDTIVPNASGSNSGWTNAAGGARAFGDVADVSGAPTINTSTQCKTDTIGDKFTFNYESSAVLPTGKTIRGLQLACAGIIQAGSTVTSISQVIRSSSTDYTGNNVNFGTTTKGFHQIYETNPAGGSAWDTTSIAAVEAGAVTA